MKKNILSLPSQTMRCLKAIAEAHRASCIMKPGMTRLRNEFLDGDK